MTNILRRIRRFIAIIGAIILLATIGLEMIAALSNGANEVVNALHITNQQSALAERITKDALSLTQDGDHSQAILELQVSLPVFEKNQAVLGGFQTSDPTLQIPMHIPSDVALLILQSQSDYTALDSAARSILKNADPPVNTDQLSIVQDHERPYFIEMNIVARTWQQRIVSNAMAFFQIELGLGIALFVLLVSYLVLGIVIRRMKKHESIQTSPTSVQTSERQ